MTRQSELARLHSIPGTDTLTTPPEPPTPPLLVWVGIAICRPHPSRLHRLAHSLVCEHTSITLPNDARHGGNWSKGPSTPPDLSP